MAFRPIKLGTYVIHEPARAAQEIRAALESEGGAVSATAERLGVDRATLWRWIRRLDEAGFGLADHAASLRDAGREVNPG